MNLNTQKSVETEIVDFVVDQLKSNSLEYKRENVALNNDIDAALTNYASKSGGAGGNRPDAKLILTDKNGTRYPVLIECKGYKDKLEKLDASGRVANRS